MKKENKNHELVAIPGCIHNHVGEEVVVNSCQLSGHGRLGYVDQAVTSKLVSAEGKVFLKKINRNTLTSNFVKTYQTRTVVNLIDVVNFIFSKL